MPLRLLAVPALVALLSFCAPARAADAAAPVDFSRDVRPILSQNCFRCHGIDDKARKAKLRLDVPEGSVAADTKSGRPAVVPGRPGESELVRRITSTDPDTVMPPPAMKVSLTASQKDVLRRWVEQGAQYQPHWAFQRPVQAPLPDVKRPDWCRNAIDRFVLARLEREGLTPSPDADRYTLARRVSLDLIGLPPTPAEVDAFVNDASPDAYEQLVDRLLASPHYGERWARRWLDLARYADTNGYEKDRPRSIWPYRDWVINALNADMPFDQFTVEQIAGDLLPDATVSQRVATGFHRNTMLNEEGGIDPLEFRFNAMVDRTNTTGTAWLGLTVGCAQCHTHKYDPIRHSEYYGLMALLNNADEPEMSLPATGEMQKKRREVEDRIAALTKALPDKWPAGDAAAVWSAAPTNTRVTTTGGSRPDPVEGGAWRFVGEDPDRDTYTFTFDANAGKADRLRLEVLKDGKLGPGRTPHGNFVLSEVAVNVLPKDASAGAAPQQVKLVRAEADFSQAEFEVARAIDGKGEHGWAIDGPGGARARTAVFYFEKPVELPQGGKWTVTLAQQYGGHHTIASLRLSLGASAPGDERPVEVRRKERLDRAFAAWQERQTKRAVTWTVAKPTSMASNTPFLTQQDDGSVLASGDISKRDVYDLTFDDAPAGVTAVRLEALPHPSLPKNGPGLTYYEGPAGDFFLSEVTGKSGGGDLKIARAVADSGSDVKASIDGDPQTGWTINPGQGEPHVAVFALEKPTPSTGLSLRLLFERYHAASLGHFRISFTTDARALADPAALPLAVAEALVVAPEQRSESQRETIFSQFLAQAPELAAARKEIADLRNSIPEPPTTLVMRERAAGHGRETHRHNRGEFLQPAEVVQPGVPAFLPQLPKDQPANRLTFARWLVAKENPLTARVTVNRQWQAFFGRGLVRTSEDFGFQGELPSHPELLDWLAVHFMDDGWSLKRLHRLIVTSSTYRQSSRVTPDLVSRDPNNVLLARGPRVRVEAEIVRDSALRASGLLTDKLGGPSVFPPQPSSVTTEGTYGAFTWATSTGPDRYRRSLYTFAKRTAPFAMYGTFDAPTGEACLARREVSNTPLQALTLLNDTVFVEAAQALGKTLAQSKETDEAKAAELLRRVASRPPDADEVTNVVDFVKRQRERLTKKELDAAKIAGGGDGDVAERAAWTAAARVVLNLDEAVTKE